MRYSEWVGSRGGPIKNISDVSHTDSCAFIVKKLILRRFGSIDIVVNNASAISLTDVASTPMKKYDLINGVNARGTYLVTKAALPYLMRSGKNAHVLMISPPLSMNPKWFARHTAYTIAKYGMSMCVLGMSAEFRPHVCRMFFAP